ncbi:hypothetical protein HYX06_04260 [Candidatus Woesearchaeota archaeon]|nr:hypothetical protein [Candidatus Woesearchaeota archaeon]
MLSIILPQLEHQKRAKDLIISILAMKYPLSSKKIFNEIKKRYGYSITYQAIHKTILQLLEQGVLVKENMDYSINMQWIDEVSNFVERMKESYEKQKKYPFGIIDMQTTENMQMIVFDNFLSAELFTINLVDKYCSNLKSKEPCCMSIQHIKEPTFQCGEALQKLRLYKEAKIGKYILVRGNNFIDGWGKSFFKGVFECILGVDVAKDYETYICGDAVIQLHIPIEVSKKINTLFSNAKSIEEIRVPQAFSDIYERKCKVQLLIYKNQEIAEQLRQKTLSYFNNNS